MTLFCRSTACLCLFAFLATAGQTFAQGSLTPPGPPGPTMKSLNQMEPRTPISSLPFAISRSGSYYLTTNLVGIANTNGITVQANDVTIDLNGFALVGLSNSVIGIDAPFPLTGVTVRNGTLRGWDYGVYGRRISHGQFYNLQVTQCRLTGIEAGRHGLVKECSAGECQTGITTSSRSTVVDCVAGQNKDGFSFGDTTTALGCRADANQFTGFYAQFGCALVNCSASLNTNGFDLVAGCSAVNCTASGNRNIGIKANDRCTVRDCNSFDNLVGFHVSSGSQAVNNTATGNTTEGILASGSDSALEGNTVTGNLGFGLRVTSAGNLIIRNKCSNNNTNFNVVANNVFGPVLSTSAALTNASPWANFAF